MFGDLFDAVSMLWSWSWPTANGEATVVEVERVRLGRNVDTLRLCVAYKFTVGNDGPYTGESFWAPIFFGKRRVIAARQKVHSRQRVLVRYRTDNPSVNRLDSSVWREL